MSVEQRPAGQHRGECRERAQLLETGSGRSAPSVARIGAPGFPLQRATSSSSGRATLGSAQRRTRDSGKSTSLNVFLLMINIFYFKNENIKETVS